MRHPRLTIARLLGVILILGLVFAGLRSGSDNWFRSIYTLTIILLIYAAIAARFRGAFWYGFAVAGWAYFVIGFGPWIGSEPPGTVNKNLLTSVILDSVSTTMSRIKPEMFYSGSILFMHTDGNGTNRDGIGHCALTILFGFAGGLVARRLAKEEQESLVAH